MIRMVTCGINWFLHALAISNLIFKALVYGLLLDDAAPSQDFATLRQYDVTSFYKTEGCFQALARRTGMGGNAWKRIRTCVYIRTNI